MAFDMMQPFLQLLLAAFLGALVGLERKSRRKEAGLRTFALVALGACLLTMIASALAKSSNSSFPSAGVLQAVAIGIGFLGSGLIFRKNSQVEGLTTAAALWTTAAVGVGVGFGFIVVSAFSTVLALLILSVFTSVEERIFPEKQ